MKRHNHQICIKAALSEAEELCRERSVRFTPIRKHVLQLIWQSHKAIKAYDLLELLRANGVDAKPPTVYRALDFLMTEGLVHKVESLNAYIGCPHPSEGHIGQFMICGSCENVSEIGSETLSDGLKKVASKSGFKVTDQTIELHGICTECQIQS